MKLVSSTGHTLTRFYLRPAREVPHYRSDDTPDLVRILANTRSHWAIENTVHGTLDRSFGEDACRIRKDNAPLAMATIRHVALNLLQATKQKRESIKRLRKMAGGDNHVLMRILGFSWGGPALHPPHHIQ